MQELEFERGDLVRADKHISEGLARLGRQEDALAVLRANGGPFPEAEQLYSLTSSTLTEWQRHRVLIVERIAYLEESLIRME
jgi:hypothetical protein